MSFLGLSANSSGLSSTLGTTSNFLPIYPFSVGGWIYITTNTGVQAFWSASNASNTTNYWSIILNGSATPLTLTATAGGVSASNVMTTGQWWYVIGRFIGATNRRLTVLEPNIPGLEEVQTSASISPSGYTNVAWGFGRQSTPTGFWNGYLAECWRTNTDIQPGGAALQKDILFQLAYKGPLSISHVAGNLIEYHPFRQSFNAVSDTIDDPNFDRFGHEATAWTTNGTPRVGPHPPLASDYVYLNTLKQNLIV